MAQYQPNVFSISNNIMACRQSNGVITGVNMFEERQLKNVTI